jgi:hypothetical protein
MNPPLLDDVWKRKGINILWSGNTLSELGAASNVISLRRFFELYEAGWPDDQIPWINDSALMVAGLDVAIDALSPEEAEPWIEQQVYTKIQDYQTEFDSQCSLIFWMSDQNRWKEKPGEVEYDWHLTGKYQGQLLPIGRCIWNGAQNGVRRIETTDSNGKQHWIGLHHHRIS